MNNRATVPRIEHIALPFSETFTACARVTRREIDKFKVLMVNGRVFADHCEDPTTSDMLYRLVVHIIEAQPPKEIRYRYPLTWWDHFKEACFPAWALKRWPAVYRTQTTVIKDIYPFPSIDLGKPLGPVVRIARTSAFTEWPDGEDER